MTALSLLPPRPFLTTMSLRTALLWLFIRGAAWVGSAAAEIPYPLSLEGPPLSALFVYVAVLIAVRVEIGRRSERIFLFNLGYSFGQLAIFVAAECAILEVAMRLCVG